MKPKGKVLARPSRILLIKKVGDKAQEREGERSLAGYLRLAWPILEPVTPLVDNWHIDYLSEHLEAAASGKIKRLLINIPPKSLKSSLVSVMWPTWVWGPANRPGTRWMFASYSDTVAGRDSLNRRNLIGSSWYQQKWGDRVVMQSKELRLKDTEHVFQNGIHGRMQATTMEGEATGLGGWFLVIDDPHNPSEILHEADRKKATYNFDQKLFNRLDDKKNGVIVIIMQRLHENDLSGHVLSTDKLGKWVHVKIPMIAPERTTYTYPVTKRTYERDEGEYLCVERESPDEIAEYRERLTEYGFAGQYQQEPVPLGGGLFKEEYFKRWPIDPEDDAEARLPKFTRCTQSWDCAFKANEENSYSVCTTWAHTDRGYFLLNVWRKHVEYPELRAAMEDLAKQYNPDAILIEDKASGQSAIQELKRAHLPIIAIKADGDKKSRAAAAAAQAEAGKIWIPRGKPWAAAYLHELCTFPKGEYDDQVDSTSQFINWARAGEISIMDGIIADNERELQRKISLGIPIDYESVAGLPAGIPGSAVYGCAYPGCDGVIRPNEPCTEKMGLKYCWDLVTGKANHTVW